MEPLLPKINFAPTVGVAPGTTTMELGQVSIGELPGQQATVQGQGQGTQIDDPYASDSRLSGPTLSDGTPDLITGTILDPDAWGPGSDVQPNPPVRWGLVALTAMTVFAGVVGWGVYARSRGKRDSVLGDGVDAPWDADTADPDDEDPYGQPKIAKDNGDCLKLGNNDPAGRSKYKYGQYETCLTENQKKQLFGKNRGGKVGTKLGCGLFACAYTAGTGKVVKFTRDPEDVAALMQAQSTGVVPKLYNVYELAQGGRNDRFGGTQVYAMTLEKLKTPDAAEKEALSDDLYIASAIADGESRIHFCQEDEHGEGGCSETVDKALAVIKKLKDAGINWTDVHAGNVGYDKNGNLKALDLGVSGTKLDREPDVLEGSALVKLRKSLGLVKL